MTIKSLSPEFNFETYEQEAVEWLRAAILNG
jgi:hypothetical protein